MKVLVINAGSSSLKYQLIDMDSEKVLAKGNCERIGQEGAFIGFKAPDGTKIERKTEMVNHTQAFEAVKDALLDPQYGAIKDLSEVSAIGHRVVQGGSYFNKSVLVTDDVIKKIEELAPLAPLHNPAHIQGINACTKVFGKDVPQVVVFDTAFHQTMPKRLICLLFHINTMKSTVSAVTASTVLLTVMYHRKWLNLWAGILKIQKSLLVTSATVHQSQLSRAAR